MANKAINMFGAYQLYIRQNSIPRSQLVRDADWLECYPISIKPFRDFFDSRNLEKEAMAMVVILPLERKQLGNSLGRGKTGVPLYPPSSTVQVSVHFLFRRLGLFRLISPWIEHTVLYSNVNTVVIQLIKPNS
jgi:hypothetical protein